MRRKQSLYPQGHSTRQILRKQSSRCKDSTPFFFLINARVGFVVDTLDKHSLYYEYLGKLHISQTAKSAALRKVQWEQVQRA